MRPLLGQLAAPVGKPVEQRRVVSAEPGEKHLVVRRADDVDEVELKQPEPPDHAAQVAQIDAPAWPRPVESLRRERDPARLGNGD